MTGQDSKVFIFIRALSRFFVKYLKQIINIRALHLVHKGHKSSCFLGLDGDVCVCVCRLGDVQGCVWI